MSYQNKTLRACVGDFGLTGKSGGTAIFMAPEGLGTESRIKEKTDLYSFAMTSLFLIFPIDLCMKLLYVPISSELKAFRNSLRQLPILDLIFQALQSNPEKRPDFNTWKNSLMAFKAMGETILKNKISADLLNQIGVELQPLHEAEKDDMTMVAINSFFNFDTKTYRINEKWWKWTRNKSHLKSLSLDTLNFKSKAISKSKI